MSEATIKREIVRIPVNDFIVPEQARTRLNEAGERERGESMLQHGPSSSVAVSTERCDRESGANGIAVAFLGHERASLMYMLRMFTGVGDGFAMGATSLKQISRWLHIRSCYRSFPKDLPCDMDSLTRCCSAAEDFFGLQFGSSGKALLFRRTVRTHRITNMTDLGVEAWALAEDALIEAGIIDIDE